MRTLKKRHFLLHTLEHLVGVVVVLGVAFALGMLGKSVGVGTTIHLAQTGSSGSTTVAYTTAGTSGSSNMVSFRAERQEISCTDGRTRARYRFEINPEAGGFIILTTSNGPIYIDATNGGGMDRTLDLGAYVWTGGVKPGFVGAGSGSFTVEQACATPPPSGSTTPPPTPGDTSGATVGVTTGMPVAQTNTSDAPNLVSVSFGVQPAPTTLCSPAGIPLTPVLFVVTREFGGRFILNSDNGIRNAPYVAGEHQLANGRYRWEAVVNSGYTGTGPLSGEFDIAGSCQATQASMPTTSPDALNPAPTPSPQTPTIVTAPSTVSGNTDTTLAPLPRPQLSLFIDNVPVSSGRVFNKEEVEVRVKTAASESVLLAVYETGTASRVLGKAERDDLLSQPGVDVWSFIVDMGELPEGKPKLQARVKHNDKRETQTEPLPVTVTHPKVVTTPKPVPEAVSPAREVPPSNGELRTSVRVSERDRAQVLSRVSDPSTCGSAEECQIYCRSLPGVNDLCLAFARETVVTYATKTSIVADLPQGDIERMLGEFSLRPKELPEALTEHAELVDYCAVAEHFETCAQVARSVAPSTNQLALEEKRTMIERAQREERAVLTERTGTRAYLDEDQDGVTDYDEVNIYKTDPRLRDSDDDGFDDGVELLARTNPLGGVIVTVATSTKDATTTTRTDETVNLQNPLIAGVVEAEILEVKTVEVLETGVNEHGSSTVKKLKVAGRAQPNSFVTLYIFSDPIVVTVKADASGAWSYTLDKELPDGSHKVYSAITDAGGRILAKSEPLPFVKVASAVSLGGETLDARAVQDGFFTGASLYAMIAMLIGILGIALSIIGFIVRQKSDGVTGLDP